MLYISILLFQNCGNKDSVDSIDSPKTIEINLDFLKGDSPEYIIEKLDTINLDVSGNPPLTAVQDLVFSQDFFLLLDRKQGLLKFANDGRFLGKIGENGEGPSEYSMPYAIHVEEKERVVLVADWQKMTVISYGLEGEFKSASNKLAGHPISFYVDNDTLLLVQETMNGTAEQPRQVLISSIEPKCLEVTTWKRALYGYQSQYTNIHPIPRILSRVNKTTLFYMPIIRGEISSHSDRDTIFRKHESRLSPEYLLHFVGFDKKLQLKMGQIVMSDEFAFLRVVYDNQPYFFVIDLENNRPIIHLKSFFDQEITDEMIPRPFKGNVYYSILRDKDNATEKNPQLVFYRFRQPIN